MTETWSSTEEGSSTEIQARVDAYIDNQSRLDLLRFITCGSVDDGKSTLIGRMLYEAQLIFEDQVTSLQKDSQKVGTQGGDIDFALLVDGLAAEREQGITIDVAYRFFNTDRRKFIVADTPGMSNILAIWLLAPRQLMLRSFLWMQAREFSPRRNATRSLPPYWALNMWFWP